MKPTSPATGGTFPEVPSTFLRTPRRCRPGSIATGFLRPLRPRVRRGRSGERAVVVELRRTTGAHRRAIHQAHQALSERRTRTQAVICARCHRHGQQQVCRDQRAERGPAQQHTAICSLVLVAARRTACSGTGAPSGTATPRTPAEPVWSAGSSANRRWPHSSAVRSSPAGTPTRRAAGERGGCRPTPPRLH